MIHKPRKKSLMLLKHESLEARLPSSHPKIPQITSNLKKLSAGYNGEKSVDYYLSFLDFEDYHIFHDIRLPFQNHYFQIDTIILTSYFILLLEIKNIAGTLYFDPIFNQFIRNKDGIDTGFPNPLFQMKLHKIQLQRWLNHHINIPIYTYLVISNPQTIVRTSKDNETLNQAVIHANYLLEKIEQIPRTDPVLPEPSLHKISKNLLAEHKELNYPILEKYHISQNELTRGIICCRCSFCPVQRVYGTWHCPSCSFSNENLHQSALNDYYLLINDRAMNRQIRQFLQVNSRTVVHRLLKEMEYPLAGFKKSAFYQLCYSEVN